MKPISTDRLVSAVLLSILALPATVIAKKDPYPDWYYNVADAVPGALNSASCVPIPGGNMEIARKQALANGRADIASQLETRVKAMDKTFDSMTAAGEEVSVETTFESVSKQVTNKVLSGVRAVKNERVKDGKKYYFCSLVSLDEMRTKAFVDAVLKSSGAQLPAKSEAELRAQFDAYKAEQELDKQAK